MKALKRSNELPQEGGAVDIAKMLVAIVAAGLSRDGNTCHDDSSCDRNHDSPCNGAIESTTGHKYESKHNFAIDQMNVRMTISIVVIQGTSCDTQMATALSILSGASCKK